MAEHACVTDTGDKNFSPSYPLRIRRIQKKARSTKKQLSCCWHGRAILHNSNFRCRIWVGLCVL